MTANHSLDWTLKPEGKSFSGWYKLSEEVEKALATMETVSVEVRSNGTSIRTIKLSGKTLAGFKRLPTIGKEQYVREGKVVDKPQDAAKRILQPQLFIPNVKAEDIQAAFIYKTTFTTEKGKDKFLYYKGYQIWRDANPNVMTLEGFEDIDSEYSFVTIATQPHQNGVWVNMSLMRKQYSRYGNNYSISYKDYDAGNFGFVNMKSYWRSKADGWARLLLSVYYEFYGRYDYGITWEEETGKEGNIFKIDRVNSEAFPELNGVKKGDALVAINDVPTSFMRTVDLNYWLDANGDTVLFTVKNESNEEKKITIKPQFKPAIPMAKDYKTLISAVPKKFIKLDKQGLEFANEPSFYPIERGF